jgi:hypothetical protein
VIRLPNAVVERWNGFWHVDASPLALGVFRILFACCLWDEVSTTASRSVFAVEGGGFHLPYAGWIPLMPEWIYGSIHDVQLVFIVLLGIGLFTRVSCAVLLLLQGWVFFADQLNFRNHPYFFLLVLLLLALSPAGRALAVGPLIRARREGRPLLPALAGSPLPITMQRLIQAQVCLVYLFAGLHKLRPAFLEGAVLHGILWQDLPTGTSGELLSRFVTSEQLAQLFQTGWLFGLLAWATAVLELSLPLALWSRRTRPAAILVGSSFHLAIALVMEIHVFSYAMVASYLLFLEPGTVPGFFGRAMSRARRRSTTRLAAASAGADVPSAAAPVGGERLWPLVLPARPPTASAHRRRARPARRSRIAPPGALMDA